MKTSENLSETLSLRLNLKHLPVDRFFWLIAGLAFIGFLDASYLTITHYTGADLVCGPIGDCNIVTSSQYAEVFGIPVALGGALYYLTMLLSALFYEDSKNPKILPLICFLPIAGLLASLWFIYVQLFLINAICLYCMVSAIDSTILFFLGSYLALKIYRKN